MNSLEKYASKKKLIENLSRAIYGEKPLGAGLGALAGGASGGNIGSILGMLGGYVKPRYAGGDLWGRSGAAYFGGLAGTLAGIPVGATVGGLRGRAALKKYLKRRRATNIGLGALGGGGLAALLSMGKKD